jgi:hypothetical protein
VSRNQHTDGYGQLVRDWLVNKGEMYEQLVARPKVMPYFEHLSALWLKLVDAEEHEGERFNVYEECLKPFAA